MDSKADSELVALVLAGDLEAFGVLITRHYDRVYAAGVSVLRDRDTALDITQEAFLTARDRLHQLEAPNRFAQWVAAIASNAGRSRLRNSNRHVCLDSVDEGDHALSVSPSQSSTAESVEGIAVALDVLNLLEEPNRQTAKLFYLDRMSYREIADRLSVPITTIESRLHRVKRTLRSIWENPEETDRRWSILAKLKELSQGGMKVDAVKIEIGCDLIPCVNDGPSPSLIHRLGALRKRLKQDAGLKVPPVRIVDNVKMGSTDYRLVLRDSVVSEGSTSLDEAVDVLASSLETAVLERRSQFG